MMATKAEKNFEKALLELAGEDFAWRNTNTIDKSHQELMAERDALMEKHNALHISARKDRDERDALRAQVEELKTVPMKYRRMEFNAQLQKENAELSAQVEELKRAFHNASAGFELAYVAIEQGRYDEALMHCGAHQARMLKTLQEQPK